MLNHHAETGRACRYMRLIKYVVCLASIMCVVQRAGYAATFGRVVPIGGHASDIALDEQRGVLYIANYTSSRVDVMSLDDNTVDRSYSVAPYPGSLALSPDGRFLVITHYASPGGESLSKPGQDALTVIDLSASQKRTFGLSSGPVGVAFGIDGLALILTQDEFLLFDPASGRTSVLDTVANVKSQTLPAPLATFPSQITAAALTATADGRHIFGIGGTTPDTGDKSLLVRFSYNVTTKQITANQLLSSAPSLGPRVISASRDGSYYMTGWALIGCGPGFLGDCTAGGPLVAQWPNSSGALQIGSVGIRSSKGLIYAQMVPKGATPSVPDTQTVCFPNGACVTYTNPPSTSSTTAQSTVPPALLVLDADNLTVRERIALPENLAGRSLFNSDESMLYSISDSGVTVFSMAALDRAPRVTASLEDVVFRGNFCTGGAPLTQEMDVIDPGGNATAFKIGLKASPACPAARGISFSTVSGVTPARVKVTVDPAVIGSMIGTTACTFEISSAAAVNMPAPPARGIVETDYQMNVRSRFRVLINNRVPENRGAFFNVPGQLVDVVADPARSRFYVLRQDKNQVLVFDSTTYTQIATLRTSNTPTQMAITFDRNYLLVGHNDSQLAYRYDLNTLAPAQPIVFPIGHYPRSIAASANAVLAASRVAGPVHTIDRIDLAGSTASPLSSLGPYKNDVNVSTALTAAPNGSTILAAMPDGNVLLYSASADSFVISRKDFPSLKGSYAASSYGSYMVDRYMLNQSLVQVASVLPTTDYSSGFAFVDQDGMSMAVGGAGDGRPNGNGYIRRVSTPAAQSAVHTGIVEAPLISDGDKDYPFSRTLAPLPQRNGIVALTTSGFTVLPWNFDAATAVPVLDRIVNGADFTRPVAPGGLIAAFGSQLSPMTLASTDAPLPTVLADSCLTVNGMTMPMQFVSPTQINAQLPYQMNGNVAVVLHTPGGVSNALNLTILPTAPAVFRSGTAGPMAGIPTVVRANNDDLVTNSNPVHLSDRLTVYLTGMGQTSPKVEAGAPAPFETLAAVTVMPTVTLGGVQLPVEFAGLTPGMAGVYQINLLVPFKGVPTGFDIPLVITQGGTSTSIPVRVVN